MNHYTLMAALAVLLPSLPAQEQAAAVEPGTIVIERGGDRIVVRWNGGAPRVTVNDQEVASNADPIKPWSVGEADGYKVRVAPIRSRYPAYWQTPSDGTSQPSPYFYWVDEDSDPPVFWDTRYLGEQSDEPRPHIGVQVGSVPEPLVEHLELDAGKCVLILAVTEGGPADRAGVKANDILIGVGGRDAVTEQTLREAVGACKAGDKLRLRVLRRGEEREAVVEVGTKGAPRPQYWQAPNGASALEEYIRAHPQPGSTGLEGWPSLLPYLVTPLGQGEAARRDHADQTLRQELAAIRAQLTELKELVEGLRR
ncbi:MAG: PDZ domain-containing protein [Planctomycetes bacterium]|nr:PDZ domain-containing protein [Planctomycetota bacterium]